MLTYLTQQQPLDARKIRSKVEELKQVTLNIQDETDQDYDVISVASNS